jgi:hypothetical protein
VLSAHLFHSQFIDQKNYFSSNFFEYARHYILSKLPESGYCSPPMESALLGSSIELLLGTRLSCGMEQWDPIKASVGKQDMYFGAKIAFQMCGNDHIRMTTCFANLQN